MQSFEGLWISNLNSFPLVLAFVLTAVCAGIFRLSISIISNQFSTDYLATVGPILMIPTADPHALRAYNVKLKNAGGFLFMGI